MSKPQKRKSKAKEAIEEIEKAEEEVEKEAARAGRAIRKEVERSGQSREGGLPTRPAGRTPTSVVVARHGAGTVTRPGRGFSMGELSEAGLEPKLATRWGVWVDSRRRSVLGDNVNSLKGWNLHQAAPVRVEREPMVVVERVEEVGKEAKKAATAAGKKVAEAERRISKRVKRTEKAVRKKVEKTKVKRKKRR